jgi:hypothetical protein
MSEERSCTACRFTNSLYKKIVFKLSWKNRRHFQECVAASFATTCLLEQDYCRPRSQVCRLASAWQCGIDKWDIVRNSEQLVPDTIHTSTNAHMDPMLHWKLGLDKRRTSDTASSWKANGAAAEEDAGDVKVCFGIAEFVDSE